MDKKEMGFFEKRDYENRFTSFEGFNYQSESVLSDSDLNKLDVLKSFLFFDTIKMRHKDCWDVVIEKMENGVAGRFNPFEQQIIFDDKVLKDGFDALRSCYIHELTHKIVGKGHGTNFFILCCVISCRYYKRRACDLVLSMQLYDCQDVRVYDGSTYTTLSDYADDNAINICARIRDYLNLDFQDFIREIEFLASSRYTIEEIADYLKERDNLLIYV